MNTRNKHIKSLIFVFFLLLSVWNILIPSCSSAGNTIYVDDSNTSGPWQGTLQDPFQTITEGIQSASAGDTVYVFSGTYTENIVITKNLFLLGESRDTTIIQPNATGHVVQANGTYGAPIQVHIQEITVRNAYGLGYDNIAFSYVQNGDILNTKLCNSDESDGIQLYQSSMIVIRDNIISNNKGAGISLTLSSNNTIDHNFIELNQKGIHLYLSSTMNEIYSNTLTGNSQYGVYVAGSSNNILYENDFTSNGENAYDPSVNSWSKNSQGNYWDDYNYYDENDDGIGDVPYEISGGSNTDAFPLGYFLQHDPSGGGNQPPIAYQPTITPSTAPYGDIVSFTGGGSDIDGYINGYSWKSSIDGQLSTQQSFNTSDLSEGTHTITFKVQDNEGAWSSEKTTTITITSNDYIPPTAIIDSILPNPALFGESVIFQGHGIDANANITEYKWTSSIDNILSNQSQFNTSSLSLGKHTITFQVKNNQGIWSDAVTMELRISQYLNENGSNYPPIANAGGPYIGYIAYRVEFDASKSDDVDGYIMSYTWDFGDGKSTTGVAPKHTYMIAGNYTVMLTVVDNEGAQSSTITYVLVGQTQDENPGSGFIIDTSLFEDVPIEFLIGIPMIIIICLIGLFLWRMRH